jgi:glycosyltransferase involved in cell wall biosynthesis
VRALWFTDWQPPAVRRRLGLPAELGPQAWVDELAAGLRGRPGVELTIATPGARRFDPFDEGGVGYVDVPLVKPEAGVARVAWNWRHRLTPAETLAAAAAVVDRLRPDVVHVHGTEGGFGLLARMRPGTRLVISLQGILQAYERVYFAGRTPGEVARLVAGAEFLKGRGVVHRYLLLRRQAARERQIMGSARWFIGRTGWDRRLLAYVNPEAGYFHCDEIMRPEFSAARWAPPRGAGGDGGGGVRIYTTSSALMGKGTECLLEAVAIMAGRGAHRPVLRVAGVHPGSELDVVYRRAAGRLGVAGRVEWIGRLDAAAIARELAAADVFAYPSHVDNSPNSVAEAMLVGAPIVASRVGGIPSLLRDGEEGLLVPRGDAPALAAALSLLLDDRAAAARLGARARATAVARHDPAHITERTLEIYAEVIGRSGVGAAAAGCVG